MTVRNVRMNRELHAAAVKRAKEKGVEFSQHVRELVAMDLANRKTK
jgi:predicted HicB family RNase H-like nuclease